MEIITLHSGVFIQSFEEMECPYFPGRKSRIEFLFPVKPDPAVYGELLAEGYRRTGVAYYRNRCEGCAACVPIRMEAAAFRPSKSQRRNWKLNSGIRVETALSKITREKVELYARYIAAFHPDEKERDVLTEIFSIQEGFPGTLEMDFYIGESLAGVSVLDECPDALSADYFYHDPDFRKRGLGVFSVQKEIELCLKMKKRYYYLGYYISDCRKMSYKSRYRPFELYIDGKWTRSG